MVNVPTHIFVRSYITSSWNSWGWSPTFKNVKCFNACVSKHICYWCEPSSQSLPLLSIFNRARLLAADTARGGIPEPFAISPRTRFPPISARHSWRPAQWRQLTLTLALPFCPARLNVRGRVASGGRGPGARALCAVWWWLVSGEWWYCDKECASAEWLLD